MILEISETGGYVGHVGLTVQRNTDFESKQDRWGGVVSSVESVCCDITEVH
jgi:hypothetical protein